MQKQPGVPGCSPDGAVVAIVGAYSKSTPETAQTFDGRVAAGIPTTASLCAPAQAEQKLQPRALHATA